MLRRLTPILAVVLILSSCTSGTSLRTGPPGAGSEVTALRSIGQLQDRFNRDDGTIRLILLVSPT